MTEVFQTADARGAYDQYLLRSFEKLHVNSLPAAVAVAIRSGLLELH